MLCVHKNSKINMDVHLVEAFNHSRASYSLSALCSNKPSSKITWDAARVQRCNDSVVQKEGCAYRRTAGWWGRPSVWAGAPEEVPAVWSRRSGEFPSSPLEQPFWPKYKCKERVLTQFIAHSKNCFNCKRLKMWW